MAKRGGHVRDGGHDPSVPRIRAQAHVWVLATLREKFLASYLCHVVPSTGLALGKFKSSGDGKLGRTAASRSANLTAKAMIMNVGLA